MTDTPITPALTPDQWNGLHFYSGVPIIHVLFGECEHEIPNSFPGARHRIAALCLHAQPFGFTQQDITVIESLYQAAVAAEWCGGHDQPSPDSIVARISALLPPSP